MAQRQPPPAPAAGDNDFSVLVLASDLTVDASSFLPSDDVWHDCPVTLHQHLLPDDFSDLDALHAFRFEGADKAGNRILRIVGKLFPAVVISSERLKNYIFQKFITELPEGPFCIVYMHSTVQKEDNSPGLYVLRWIYEGLPQEIKERLNVVYFVHPGIRSRLAFATLGRLFLSGGLYWKIKYVSRLQYLWDDVKKGEVEIPEFVKNHDDILEHRPLTDYGIEPDPFHMADPLHMAEPPALQYSFRRHEERWGSRALT